MIEMMIVVAMLAALATFLVQFLPKQAVFFRHTKVRQQVVMDSRVCMETIRQRLRNGRARTLGISTPPAASSTVPNSRVDFVLQSPLTSGATAYAVYLVNGYVYGQEFVPPGPQGAQPPHLLASNVTGLTFTTDSTDPGQVYVTLRMDAPWDDSNDPTHVSSILLPNQAVRMVETP